MALAGTEKSYGKTFFVVSQILVLLALYSIVDEAIVRRPWKAYQHEFNHYQEQKFAREYEEAMAEFEKSGVAQKIADLKLSLEQAEIAMESDEYKTLAKSFEAQKLIAGDLELDVKFKKATLDSYYYEWKHSFKEGHEWESKKEKYDALAAEIEEAKKVLASEQAKLNDLQEQTSSYQVRVTKLQEEIASLNKPLVEAKELMESVKFRPIEIKQLVIDGFGKSGNIKWGRVDRCMTCHVTIDKNGFDDVGKAFGLTVVDNDEAKAKLVSEKPEDKGFVVTQAEKDRLQTLYGTHPRRQELLGDHPVERFGCTSCHGGNGRGVNIKGEAFGHYDKAHGYQHHAVEPLLREKQMESNCLTCHMGEVYVGGAEELTKGLQLFTQLGCHGCHAVAGYEDLEKVGPELNKVGGKVKTAWLVDWLKNPFEYMPSTRMPHFGLDDDEVLALSSYLVSNTRDHDYQYKMSVSGQVSRGKDLFNKVGCRGCHAVETTGDALIERGRASHLGRLSAKIKDKAWVYDWLKDPKNYSEHARMPSLRLSDQEAADLTEYLMSLSPGYEKELLARSSELAAKVNPQNQEWIAKGRKIVSDRGCFGCHSMHGFAEAGRIGPSLTDEATKDPVVFDFGDALAEGYSFSDVFGDKVQVTHLEEYPGELTADVHEKGFDELTDEQRQDVTHVTNLEETWQAWVRNKLRYPLSIYDHDRAVLKMPNFHLTDDELDSLLVFLKGLKGMDVSPEFNASYGDVSQAVIEGEHLLANKNCLGCHAVEDFGGEINQKLTDLNHNGIPMSQYFPPEITHVGEKIRPEWLAEYLKDPKPYRPAMYVRMPSFGFSDDQVNTLLDYFAGLSDESVSLTDTDYSLDPVKVAQGKALVEGYGCKVCHFINGQRPGDVPSLWAPDWKHVSERLQPEFIPHWINAPMTYQKYAVMPGYLNSDAEAFVDLLDKKADKQLEAIKEYLLSVGTE
jgi:mono/diheme cytochrome c family protein